MLALLFAVPVAWVVFLCLLAKLETITLGNDDHSSKIAPAPDIPIEDSSLLEEITRPGPVPVPVAAAVQPAAESLS